MAINDRNAFKSGGRSPPILLIGLSVALCIVGFNYWNVSSRNNNLVNQISSLRDEVHSLGSSRLAAEKRGEAALSQKRYCEEDNAKIRNDNKVSLDKCNAELSSIKSAVDRTESQCFSAKTACEQDKAGINEHLHQLEEELKDAKESLTANKTCDQNDCKDHIGNIVNILTNTIGKDPVRNALIQNNVDVKMFLSSLERGTGAIFMSNAHYPKGQQSQGAGQELPVKGQDEQDAQQQLPESENKLIPQLGNKQWIPQTMTVGINQLPQGPGQLNPDQNNQQFKGKSDQDQLNHEQILQAQLDQVKNGLEQVQHSHSLRPTEQIFNIKESVGLKRLQLGPKLPIPDQIMDDHPEEKPLDVQQIVEKDVGAVSQEHQGQPGHNNIKMSQMLQDEEGKDKI